MALDVSMKTGYDDFLLDVSFHEESKRIGILGASGSGKTLTLKSIAGIERPDSGRIVLEDRVLFDASRRIDLIPRKRRVGYLFQSYALFPSMTVYENVGAGIREKDKAVKDARIREMIGKFRLEGLNERFPSELSGGQQQRVALARMLASEPDLILLDEPFSALDVYLKDRMQEELNEFLSDYQGSVIMVSHSRDEIYRFSEDLIILEKGRIIRQGNTREVFSSPGKKAAAVLTGCKNFSSVTVMDEHTIRAEDWGIVLKIKGSVPKGTRYIGYRAHQFLPVWGEREENSIRFELLSRSELQFEKNYYIRPEKEAYDRDAVITWFVQRDKWKELEEKGLPSFLRFREEDILFLN